MNMNHIQGQTTSTKIRYGLFSEDELVSVMSFRKKDQVGTWELVRFCSSIQVIGGASKLFKYFIKLHNPKTVVSFSDNRWFTGGLYPILGFILDKEINPDYSYTKHQKRYHKFNFRKEKLQKRFDIDITNKTERQLTSELGYEMIWDCGKKRWLYTNNNFIQNKPPSSLFFIKS